MGTFLGLFCLFIFQFTNEISGIKNSLGGNNLRIVHRIVWTKHLNLTSINYHVIRLWGVHDFSTKDFAKKLILYVCQLNHITLFVLILAWSPKMRPLIQFNQGWSFPIHYIKGVLSSLELYGKKYNKYITKGYQNLKRFLGLITLLQWHWGAITLKSLKIIMLQPIVFLNIVPEKWVVNPCFLLLSPLYLFLRKT